MCVCADYLLEDYIDRDTPKKLRKPNPYKDKYEKTQDEEQYEKWENER